MKIKAAIPLNNNITDNNTTDFHRHSENIQTEPPIITKNDDLFNTKRDETHFSHYNHYNEFKCDYNNWHKKATDSHNVYLSKIENEAVVSLKTLHPYFSKARSHISNTLDKLYLILKEIVTPNNPEEDTNSFITKIISCVLLIFMFPIIYINHMARKNKKEYQASASIAANLNKLYQHPDFYDGKYHQQIHAHFEFLPYEKDGELIIEKRKNILLINTDNLTTQKSHLFILPEKIKNMFRSILLPYDLSSLSLERRKMMTNMVEEFLNKTSNFIQLIDNDNQVIYIPILLPYDNFFKAENIK